MNDTHCAFDGRRDEVLVAYLYDDIEPREREAFEAHLPDCLVCRTELDALSDVRGGLAAWAAPDVLDGIGGTAPRSALRIVNPESPRVSTGFRTFAEAPVWLQAAAAMLVVAASLGLANLNLTYSPSAGLSVSTGWMRPAPAVTPAPAPVVTAAAPTPDPWQADLTVLEQKVMEGVKAQFAATQAPDGDAALLARVRNIVQESERRQQRELALRVAEVARESQVQRQADLVKIDRNLGLIQRSTGVEVMRTQQQLNTLAQRVSQQR